MAPEVRTQAVIYLLPQTATLFTPHERAHRLLPLMLSGEEL